MEGNEKVVGTKEPEIKVKEMTLTAIILGVLLAVVFGAANAYLGLRVGLTISASIPAAVISMGVLRFVLRRDSILENNMVQTIGSAGESLAAGMIFTVPALYLWAAQWAKEGKTDWVQVVSSATDIIPVTIIALVGGALGTLMMVPLRRPLIVEEQKSLPYPEGRACADVLHAGEKGAKQASMVFMGLGLAALVKVITGGFKWIPEAFLFPVRFVRGAMGFEVSAALLGVGYVVGPKISTLLVAGAFFGWMVLVPIFSWFVPEASQLWTAEGAQAVWKQYVRYVGAGAIAMGGFISLAKSMPLFARTFKASLAGGLKGAGNAAANLPRVERDIPMKTILGGVGCVILFIWMVPYVKVGLLGAMLVALFGFFFAAVSARMVGLVGASNNPVSGMTIATLVVASLVLKVTGVVGAVGMVAAISVGSVVCIVASMAGDTAQDLKTGYLVGATPWKQELGLLIGSVASALAIGFVLVLLNKAWGFGSEQLSAPQANMMKVIVEGIMDGQLPWQYLGYGAVIAVVLAIFRVPVMPFAIGIYLPFGLNATVFAGGMIRKWVNHVRGQKAEGEDAGTLFSAGLIAGEGLCGILLAVFTVLSGK
ncbi:MAG: oligopeptide transporter, OPT family [Kiritimatiellae bacterium]|nr:oligopeptide transporter, OPT family [Kiritimatiellia bacterium]